MKSIFKIFLFGALVLSSFGIQSCQEDKFTSSIFDIQDKPLDQNLYCFPLDSFIKREFLEPYNMKFIYRMEDVGSDLDKNLTPAPYEKSVQLAALTKYLWYDCYKELAGEHEVFLKKFSPRIVHVIGSHNYNSDGTRVMGYAEGGVKVTLIEVDYLDVNNVEKLNDDYFHTMHHEFGHVLDAYYLHPQAFNLISNGKYDAMSWSDKPDSISVGNGFVSSYASSEINDDWVETISIYMTMDSIKWNNLLNTANYDWEEIDCENEDAYKKRVTFGCSLDTIGYFREKDNGEGAIYRRVCLRDANDRVVLDADGKVQWLDVNEENGREVILKKLDLVRTYLKTNYGLDIDAMRNMIQERLYVKNPDGTWKLDAKGKLVNKLTYSENGEKSLIDRLTDEIYNIGKKD